MCRAVAGSTCRWGARRGGLPGWSPADRAIPESTGGLAFLVTRRPCLYLLSCPHPPDPLPGGKGEPKVIPCKGLRPLHPRELNPARRGKRGANHTPGRGACLFGYTPPLPLPSFLPPSPQPPFPGGEGGDYKFILPGASPPAPLHLTACGTYSPCHAGARGLNPGGTEKGRTMHPAGAYSLCYRLDLTVRHPPGARRMLKNQK